MEETRGQTDRQIVEGEKEKEKEAQITVNRDKLVFGLVFFSFF